MQVQMSLEGKSEAVLMVGEVIILYSYFTKYHIRVSKWPVVIIRSEFQFLDYSVVGNHRYSLKLYQGIGFRCYTILIFQCYTYFT